MKTLIRVLLGILPAVVSLCAWTQSETKPPIIVGQTYIGTGPLASLSTEPLIGIRAMFNAVNASGGIRGRLIELRQEDDAFDATKAAENVKKLVDQGAVAILAPIGTSSSIGALKTANELKVPVIGPYTGAASVMRFSEYGFPVRIGFDEEYGRIVNHLFTVGQTRIAFALTDNPGARVGMEVTKGFIEKRGRQMLGPVVMAQDGSDAAQKARELAALKPNAVVLAATNNVAAIFLQAYRAAGAEARFYSFSFLNGHALHKAIGADAEGVVISQVMPYPWNSTMPLVAEYQAALRKIGEKEFSYASLEGYVDAKVLVEALRRAGINPSGEAIKKTLETFKPLNLGGLQVRYTPTEHTGLSFSELAMIRRDGGYAR